MRTVRLGEVCDIVSGATPKTKVPEYWDGDIEWATPADLSKLDGAYITHTPRKLTSAGLQSCASRLLPAGSVLLSSRAPIGHTAINTVPMATNQGFKSLVPGPYVYAKFLYHWLTSKTSYLQSLGNGATFQELSKATTSQIKVPLPSLDEQRRIADILDRADALRAKRRETLAHLDSLTQSIFHDMFGGLERPMTTLGDLCTFYSGGTPSKKRPELWDGGIPWFSPKDLKEPDLFHSQDTVSERAPAETTLRLLPPDTIVTVVRGMILAHTAPISVLRVPSTINQDLKAVIPKVGLDVDFLAAAMRIQSAWLLARVATAAHGTKRLQTPTLESIPIPMVDPAEQWEFARRTETARRERTAVERALAADNELFASLQSRAFRGEL